MQLFNSIAVIGLCYFGSGFFVSRFFVSNQRNNPLFWLFLSMIIIPLYVSIRSVLGTVFHVEILLLSAVCFWGFLVPHKKIFTLLPENKKPHIFLITIQILIALIFFLGLATAKLSLIHNIHDVISDDISRTQVVISTGYDLSNPRAYRNITKPLVYHHFDSVLPGTVFRLSSLSAQQSMYIHNILEYIAILSFLIYVGIYFFSTA